MNIFLKGGTCVFPDGIRGKNILVAGEKIKRVDEPDVEFELPPNTKILDVSGKYVFPGFIDAHTHYGLGEGEDATADDFFQGSRAAAAGGVTTFIDFADQLPDCTLAEGSRQRINEAKDSVIDFALHQGVYRIHERIPEELDELKDCGITVLKIYTTYKEFGVYLDPEAWKTLFPLCSEKRILVTVHPEDEEILEAKKPEYEGSCPGPEAHPLLRPAEAEASAILKAGLEAKACGMPLYIVHISSEKAMNAVRGLRKSGAGIITETTPHYLFLTEEKLKGPDGSLFLMTPPLRTEKDNQVLRAALASGEIDIVATDHCSYTPRQKRRFSDCRRIPAGVPGSGEAAVLLHSLSSRDSLLELPGMARLFSETPARIFGLYPQKGSLLPGTDADITIFSPDEEGVITAENVQTGAGYTPYEGIKYKGAPVMTILRGGIIVENGIFFGNRGAGRFQHCRESEAF